MLQGRFVRAVPACALFCLILFLLFSHIGSSDLPRGGALAFPHGSVGASNLGSSQRPIITEKLPPLPGLVQPAQGPGPVPDDDLTPGTPATDELDPWGSPTGEQNRIAFVSKGVDSDHDGRIDPVFPDDPNFTPNFNIWIMRPDGSEQHQVTDTAADEREPAYDPSGNLFAFSSNDTGTWQIYTVEISTGVVRQITRGPGNKRHPTWSTDTNWIAFQSDVNGNWDIFKMASTGVGQTIQLTLSPGDDTDPAWSPWRDEILFTADVGGMKRICLMGADGQNLTVLSNGGGSPEADDQEPAWQKNGTTIAFASSRMTEPGDTIDNFNIWRMTAAGEVVGPEAVLISDLSAASNGNNTNPTWTVGLARQPIRVIYQSNRAQDGGPSTQTNEDLWATFFIDTRPPELLEIPSVDNRRPGAGADIEVTAKVYDKDSGVAEVYAFFKNPDVKIYNYNPDGAYDCDSWLDGERYEEIDCVGVGSAQLTDPEGDGTYTGAWTTPFTPRDYIIDIMVTDNAGNSLVYDDVYGFSTKVFTPEHNILFVDDYCEGQAFLALLGYNNDYPVAYPVESYYTRNPSDHPDVYNVDYDSISGYFGKGYDTWRIICRGRIPPGVYQYYLPTVEYQLEPEEAVADPVSAQPTREVRVAPRMIIWGAPHTGDVWTGLDSGSVVDAATQADLGLFLDRGGGLFISGHDIAWSLTMNGTTPSYFLNNYLRADFVADTPCAAIGYYASRWVWIPGVGHWRMQNTGYGVTATGQGGDPVAGTCWGGCYDSGCYPTELKTPRIPPTCGERHEDAADWSLYPDHIRVLNATKLYGYAPPGGHDFGGPDAGLRYADPVTGAHLVYLAFGFEAIHRGYHQPTNTPNHCKNHRSHLIDNAFIWMCTGTFQGRVVSLDGGDPLRNPNPIVRAIQGGTVRYAVRCQDDGTYVINGIPAGSYTMEAYRPGYDIDHYDRETTHASLGPVIVDFALKQAEPGAVAGVVTSEATDEFLANVQITVYQAIPIEEEEEEQEGAQTAQADEEEEYERGPEVASTLTAADGTYDIGSLPPGYYFVVADGSGIGYGSEEVLIQITAGNTTRADFILKAADGILKVTVRDGQTLQPLAGAVVEVSREETMVERATTDTNGLAQISLQPGTYQVEAEASGYERSAPVGVLIESLETTQRTISIDRQPPGSLSGRVVSATTGNPVPDIAIKVLYGEQVLATTTTAGSFTDPGDGTDPYNFIVEDVPTGTVTVRPQPVGFTADPSERRVQIVSDQRTTGVNFRLSSLHIFPVGLQLTSVPFDYEMTDPAQLLQVPAGELLLATWEPQQHRYRLYPQAPADRLRLGQGYWLKLAGPADLREEGTRPTDPTPISLGPGWNMIGDPFNATIDLYTIQVEDERGVVQSLSKAMTAGKLQGSLFAYVMGGYHIVSALTPYTGYWLKANQPLTLHVSESAGALAAEAAAQRRAIQPPEDGWLLPLEVVAGGCMDTATYLGQGPAASVGYDQGQDLEKPPVIDLAPYVYAAFENDTDTARGNYAVDIKPEGDQCWRLAVETNLLQSPVTIRWPDMSAVPETVRLMLVDEAAGRQVYMRTASGYQYTARQPVRRLLIKAEDGSPATELTVLGLSAMATGVRRANIVYTLSQSAQVSVEVRNISGALVRQICGGQTQPAGQHTTVWNGRNRAGALVPTGRYLVRVTAVTDQGQRNSALSGFVMSR